MGNSPTVHIETKISMVCNVPDIIMCAEIQDEILGITVLLGVEFPFLLIVLWALQQYSATAVPVMCLQLYR